MRAMKGEERFGVLNIFFSNKLHHRTTLVKIIYRIKSFKENLIKLRGALTSQ